MPFKVAKNIGFCFGVRRAVDMSRKLAKEKGLIYTFGELIHNEDVITELKGDGIIPIESLDDIKSGDVLLIRSHGVPQSVFSECEKRGIVTVDATCPFVKKIHNIASENCVNRRIIVVGKKNHPEVVGIMGNCVGAVCISSLDEADTLDLSCPVCVVSQTTFLQSSFLEIAEEIKRKSNDCVVYDTTCDTTRKRQEEAEKLSRECDMMIVIGGKNSSNTAKLAEICKKNCKKTVTIQNTFDITLENIDFNGIIGIVAGASTPDRMIMEVMKMENHDTQSEFAKLLSEQEEVKLFAGKKVKGTIVSVSSEKIVVSLNYKSEGYIPADEFYPADMHTKCKEGDEIEVIVKATNDGTGMVLLKIREKERIATKIDPIFLEEEQWKDVIFDAEVKQEVKGGLEAIVKETRVFIPASQVALGYVKDLKEYVGKTLKVKVIEVTKGGKSIVASAREVLLAEREEKKREIIEGLTVGQQVKGVVKRIEKFGAFVEFEGIEGLLRTGDISWVHFEQITDELSVGQELDLIILAVDMEKLQVSLSRKKLLPKPWENVEERYHEGDIVDGKVLRIETFGAFVELEPRVEGLVHISQLDIKRVEKVEDAVAVGDTIRVKIIEIKTQSRRSHIRLSRREAILEENPEIAEQLAREKAEREAQRAAKREADEQQRKERQQQAEEERARRSEKREAERKARREEADYTIPAEEHSTTSLKSRFKGITIPSEDDNN